MYIYIITVQDRPHVQMAHTSERAADDLFLRLISFGMLPKMEKVMY